MQAVAAAAVDRFVWSGRPISGHYSHVLFECPALHIMRIKHLGPEFADKQVLINNPEDVDRMVPAGDRPLWAEIGWSWPEDEEEEAENCNFLVPTQLF